MLVKMRAFKIMGAALAAVVLLTVVGAAPSALEDGQQVAATTTPTPSPSPSPTTMPSLFDFESYKKLFKKSYSGFIENMARFKWFTSSAIQASISAIKYRFRYKNYHLSVNHMSDMSPGEFDAMRNKALESAYSNGVAEKPNSLPEFIPEDDENVVATLRKLIDENKGKPEFEALREELGQIETARQQRKQTTNSTSSKRRKRQVELAEKGPRELPLNKLVNIAPEDPDAELPAETRAKINKNPKGNNPLYEPIEFATQGLVDQQVWLEQYFLEKTVKTPPAPNMKSQLAKTLESLRQKYLLASSDNGMLADEVLPVNELPDEVFIDLRKTSNCFFAPRNQGNCGSCYSFAVTTVAEWLHCHVTGELVAFSEQYMVDCGHDYQGNHIFGCEGGLLSKTYNFFHNFGWELRSAYPYMAREQQCPYSADTDLSKVGFIRANLHSAMEYDIELWPKYLGLVGPLAIQINTGPEFSLYGSGVYDACVPKKPTHGVVLIGHGREDGEEYWLIRNSHSVGWGEGGHMKLSKKADCIWPRTGWSFGTKNGRNIVMSPTKNALNDGAAVKNLLNQQIKDAFISG